MSHHQNVGKNYNLLFGNTPFKNVAKFKYLGMIVMNENCTHEEIKRRLYSRNICHHSVWSLLSTHSPSKNFKIKIYRTLILPDVLYGCKTWSLTLREEHRLRVSENRVLWRYLDLRGRK
jgi:hypothetical protein